MSKTGNENVAGLTGCRALGVRVYAEVVSRAEQEEWLKQHGARGWDSTFDFL